MPKSVSSAMTGRLALGRRFLDVRLAEQNFPQVVLEEELFEMCSGSRQPLNIAGRQWPLLAARRRGTNDIANSGDPPRRIA
jgi:hypothetical protein